MHCVWSLSVHKMYNRHARKIQESRSPWNQFTRKFLSVIVELPAIYYVTGFSLVAFFQGLSPKMGIWMLANLIYADVTVEEHLIKLLCSSLLWKLFRALPYICYQKGPAKFSEITSCMVLVCILNPFTLVCERTQFWYCYNFGSFWRQQCKHIGAILVLQLFCVTCIGRVTYDNHFCVVWLFTTLSCVGLLQ